MGKKTKGAHRLDKFYHLAKEQGYRSRAAFKLIQLNRKYDFLSGARTLLDLCAAPGGWCQVAVKNMPVGSLVIGVDLVPIKPVRGVRTLMGDITTQQCRAAIRKEAAGALIDVVLHDGAPNVGGAWSSEAYSQSWLVLEALRMATDVLAPRGTFITKVFRSKDYSALLYALKQLFNKVEATKPAASRNASAEIFVVCQGYKAPAKIDPRLLDSRILFQDVAEPLRPAGPDALLKAKVKQRRFREGYEEGVSLSRKVLPAAAFVAAENPVELLGQFTALALDGGDSETAAEAVPDMPAAALLVREHAATTDEIALLCKDLQVLGRSEFKQLLKWRLAVRKDLQKAMAAAAAAGSGEASEGEGGSDKEAAGGSDGEEGEGEEGPEEKMLREMGEIKTRMEQQRKRERRRRRELKNKARVRAAQLVQGEGLGEEGGPEGLFSLMGLRAGRSAVDKVADAAAPDNEDAALEPSSDDDGIGSGSDGSGADSDDAQRRYDAVMDEYLEESYRSWKDRQRLRDTGGIVKKKRRRLGMDGELEDGEEGAGEEAGFGSEGSEGSEEEAAQVEEERGGGLIVSLDEGQTGVPASAAAAANQWFSQDLFDDANLQDEEEEEERPAKRQQRAKAAAAEDAAEEPRRQEVASGSDSDKKGPRPKHAVQLDVRRAKRGGGADGEGFEEVPMDASGSDSDSSDEFEGLDDDGKAEVLALARKFLRGKTKQDIMDAAYNRYAFNDTGLPKWFADDERKFMRPAPQITGAEYKAAKEELRAIDARPIKKVAEAKARKRKRLVGKLVQARQKAESIANQEDVPMKAKMREIEKVYNQARSGGKKGGKGGKKTTSRTDEYKNKGRPLDSRLRSDKRGMERAAKRAKAGGGGKGKGGGKGRR